MEIPYSKGKQHQPQSSRTCDVHTKALQTKHSASAQISSYSEEDINNFYNDVEETLKKPLHDTDERFQWSKREKTNHM